MAKKRKLFLNIIKQQCADQMRKLKKTQNDITSMKKTKSVRDKALMDLNYQMEGDQMKTIQLWDRFELQIEDELSKFDDRKELDQIFYHESDKLKERDEQIRQEKLKEQQQRENARKKEQEAIKKQIQTVQAQVDREKQNFKQLIQETQVSDIDELQDHWKYLQETEKNLIVIQEQHQGTIADLQEQIKSLKAQKKQLEYEAKEGEDTKIPETTEQVERDLRIVLDKYQEQEFQFDRQQKLIDNICVIISRILYQLQSKSQKQKNVEVERKQLLNLISICSLRLEKILAILSKKRDQIRVESINTDNEIKDPPEFIGINPKKLAFDEEYQKGFNTVRAARTPSHPLRTRQRALRNRSNHALRNRNRASCLPAARN